MKPTRRRFAVAALAGAVPFTLRAQVSSPVKKVHYRSGGKPAKTPLFSGAVSYGNLLFIAGKGAHFEGDILAHTQHVLDEVEKELVAAGSERNRRYAPRSPPTAEFRAIRWLRST